MQVREQLYTFLAREHQVLSHYRLKSQRILTVVVSEDDFFCVTNFSY